MKTKISVIIPFYNSRKFLKRAVISVINQTYRNIEIILVDDCSNDGSYKIAKKIQKTDKRIKVIKTLKNSGTVAHPRNLGIKFSKGNYISFLDADDYWYKDKLEKQLKKIGKNFICATACDYIDQNKNTKSGWLLNSFRLFAQNFIFKRIICQGNYWLYIYNPIIVSSVLINKKIFSNFLFNEDKNIREDLFLWLKILKNNNKKIIFLKNRTLVISRTKKSMSSNQLEEFSKILRTLTSDILDTRNFKKITYILFGILLKSVKFLILSNYAAIKKRINYIIFFIIFLYFIIFYSPLFWYLGKPLLKYKNYDISKASSIIVYSGHGNTSIYEITYLSRYKDIQKIIKLNPNIKKIFIIGRLQDIPQNRIIEKLLLFDGIKEKQINLIYENFDYSDANFRNLNKIMLQDNLNKALLSTSPYTSYKFNYYWKKNSNIELMTFKSSDWPKKNSFFEYSKNKKIIVKEYFSLLFKMFKEKVRF